MENFKETVSKTQQGWCTYKLTEMAACPGHTQFKLEGGPSNEREATPIQEDNFNWFLLVKGKSLL